MNFVHGDSHHSQLSVLQCTTVTWQGDVHKTSGHRYSVSSPLVHQTPIAGSSSALIPPMPTSLYSDDLVETNLGADGMYAEVNEMQRMKALSETTLLPPVDTHPPSYLEVVRDATPKDYNNEELYQSMEKIYYVVSYQPNTMS